MISETPNPTDAGHRHESNAKPSVLDQFADDFIRWKAKQLVGKAGFTRSDEDDLVQNFRLKLLERLDKFDPARAHFHVFVVTVIERCAATLLKHARAQKRNGGRVGSLDAQSVENDEEINLGEIVSRDRRRRDSVRNASELMDLASDLANILEMLPAELRQLCEQLKTLSTGDLARETGMPRSTINDKKRLVRNYFEDAGLRIYMSK